MNQHLRLTQLITKKLPCNPENLSVLKGEELECLAILLGIAKSGTKPTLIARIVTSNTIRNQLATYKTKDELYNIDYHEILEMERRRNKGSMTFFVRK